MKNHLQPIFIIQPVQPYEIVQPVQLYEIVQNYMKRFHILYEIYGKSMIMETFHIYIYIEREREREREGSFATRIYRTTRATL